MIQGMKEKGIAITPEVEEQVFVDLSDSMKKRRDRLPNVGNIPVVSLTISITDLSIFCILYSVFNVLQAINSNNKL